MRKKNKDAEPDRTASADQHGSASEEKRGKTAERRKGTGIFLFVAKKSFFFVISMLLLSAAVFCISRLAPGDPLVSYYGEQAERMSPQQRELAEERLGLNAPSSSSISAGSAPPFTATSEYPTNTKPMCWK